MRMELCAHRVRGLSPDLKLDAPVPLTALEVAIVRDRPSFAQADRRNLIAADFEFFDQVLFHGSRTTFAQG